MMTLAPSRGRPRSASVVAADVRFRADPTSHGPASLTPARADPHPYGDIALVGGRGLGVRARGERRRVPGPAAEHGAARAVDPLEDVAGHVEDAVGAHVRRVRAGGR